MWGEWVPRGSGRLVRLAEAVYLTVSNPTVVFEYDVEDSGPLRNGWALRMILILGGCGRLGGVAGYTRTMGGGS